MSDKQVSPWRPEDSADGQMIRVGGIREISLSGPLAADVLIRGTQTELLPLQVRVTPCPGMSAVIVQGGETVYTVRGTGITLAEAGVEPAEDVPGYARARVYYVRDAFDAELRWGGSAVLLGENGGMASFAYNGTCEVTAVRDPAAFLRWIRFDPAVLATHFGIQRDGAGAEQISQRGRTLRAVINGVCAGALRSVRDRMGLPAELLPACTDDVLWEIQEQANQVLEEYGLHIGNVTGRIMLQQTAVYVDLLSRRMAGAVHWQTEPIWIHRQGMPEVTATVRLQGSCHVDVRDVHLLEASTDARLWRDPMEQDSIVHDQIADHTGRLLTGLFAAVFQKLMDEVNPPLHMLPTFTSYLTAKVQQILNMEGGYLATRGLIASQLTLQVSTVGKSALYDLYERKQERRTEGELQQEMEDYQRACDLRRAQEESRMRTEVRRLKHEESLAALDMNAAREIAANDAEMRRIASQRALEEERSQQRRRTAELAAAEKADRQRQMLALKEEKRRDELAEAQHAKRMQEVFLEVQESNLTWQEKLEAFARLQRAEALREELEGEKARAEAADYAGRLELKLSEESRRVLGAIEYEEKQREEALEKERFARKLEMRRQLMQEKHETLRAETERIRAAAEAERLRMEQQREIETLRLMLDYLVRAGGQTPQAQLQQARQEAEADWQEQNGETARLQEAARCQELQEQEAALQEASAQLTREVDEIDQQLQTMQAGGEAPQPDVPVVAESGAPAAAEDAVPAEAQQVPQIPLAEIRCCLFCGARFSIHEVRCPDCGCA